LRGKRDITERPPAAERRLERGHFEVDLVHGPGSKECILTLVDRCTRLLVICKLLDKTMAEVNRVLLIMIRRLGILPTGGCPRRLKSDLFSVLISSSPPGSAMAARSDRRE
jgi:hypothetical protein